MPLSEWSGQPFYYLKLLFSLIKIIKIYLKIIKTKNV